MADDVTITVHVRDLSGPGVASVTRNLNQLQRQADQMGGSLRIVGGQLGNLSNAASSAGSSLGGGMGLKGQAIAAGAALGTTLLPTIGALAPMLSGVAVVGGGAALAMGDLKKKAKELEPAFKGWQKAAEKAVAPHTERAVKSLKSAMEDLEPSLVLGAETFGTITERASKFAASPAFQGAFQKNAQMGVVFVEQLAESVGHFTQSFLDFGTKSQPALDAFQGLLGGFLDTGLPGMFKGLEQGVGGASDMLTGLAYLLNDSLLPSLGRISGSFADAFGPLIGEMLHATGDSITGLSYIFEGAMKIIEPFADLLADGFRAMNEIVPIAAEAASSLASNVGGALLDSLLAVAGIDLGNLDGFTGLSDWVKENSPQIRSAFYDAAEAVTAFVTAGVASLPTLWSVFRMTTEGILVAVDGLVSTLAGAFGHLPGGGIFEEINRKFDEGAGKFRENLDKVGGSIDDFVGEAVPRLNRAALKMNVEEASKNLADIKGKLDDPGLTKERKAKLGADKKAAEKALADARAELAAFDKKQAQAKLTAESGGFWGAIKAAAGAKIPNKTAKVGASTGGFWSAVRGLAGRVLGTSYINVAYRKVESNVQPKFSANGNIFRSFADGGMEDHTAQIASGGPIRVWAEPETGGEAYIPLAPAKRSRSRDIAEETVGILGGAVKWFAKGGVTKAEAQARRDARGDLTVSRFGGFAGYQRSEFRSSLGNPDSISGLVNSLNQWRSIIQKATHGTTEKNLLRNLDMWGKGLLRWEKQLGTVTKSLDAAKTKLNDLKNAAGQLSGSVKSGVLNSANITRSTGSGPVTVSSIMGGLTASRDKATAFSSALSQLQKKGLSSSLLQQVAESGIEGGGLETAGALLGASSSEIRSLNGLQSQITGAAAAAGKTTADAVYGAQIKAQQALVTSLGKQQQRLVTAMDKLAAAMEKSVERAFGRKAAGGIIGAASGGLRSGWTMVGEQEPELVRLPFGSRVYSGPDTRRMQQQAWTSMLNAPRHGPARTPAPQGAGRPEPVVIELRSSGSEIDEFLLKILRRAINTRGGNAQVVLTGRR